MEDERYKELEKHINHYNEEFLIDDQQLMLFRNADDAIAAIRSGQIPGVSWDENQEQKYQELLHLEQCYSSNINTVEDDLNE